MYSHSDTGFICVVAYVISNWAFVHLKHRIGKAYNFVSGLICYTLFYIPCRMWVTNYRWAFLWFCRCKAAVTNFAVAIDFYLYTRSDVKCVVFVAQLMDWSRDIKSQNSWRRPKPCIVTW